MTIEEQIQEEDNEKFKAQYDFESDRVLVSISSSVACFCIGVIVGATTVLLIWAATMY